MLKKYEIIKFIISANIFEGLAKNLFLKIKRDITNMQKHTLIDNGPPVKSLETHPKITVDKIEYIKTIKLYLFIKNFFTISIPFYTNPAIT